MNINNGKLNCVIFLDIKTAFDTIDHKILLLKLSCHGIKDNSLKLIETYPKDRIQYCSVNGHLSSLECIKSGVPQGSVELPSQFLIYMNDITMFADDTSFTKPFKGVNEIKEHLVPAFSKSVGGLNSIS